jgi:hypothetical protein
MKGTGRRYYYCKASHALDDVTRQRIKVALYPDLNDPFELLACELSDPTRRAVFQATKNYLASTTGLICFSRSWRSLLMWSHYADKHRGNLSRLRRGSGHAHATNQVRYGTPCLFNLLSCVEKGKGAERCLG